MKASQNALIARAESDAKQAQNDKAALKNELESQRYEKKVLTEKLREAENAISQRDHTIKNLSELCKPKPNFENAIKKKLKLSDRDVLLNLHIMGDGHLFIFKHCLALMQFSDEQKSESGFFSQRRNNTHKKESEEKQLILPYGKLESLERYDHVNGPAIWFHLRNGPTEVKVIKVSGFRTRERCILDIVTAAAAVGISVSTIGSS